MINFAGTRQDPTKRLGLSEHRASKFVFPYRYENSCNITNIRTSHFLVTLVTEAICASFRIADKAADLLL